jgi:hypothetical protein
VLTRRPGASQRQGRCGFRARRNCRRATAKSIPYFCILGVGFRYSIFDSALYRNRKAEWLFPDRGPCGRVLVRGVEEKATLYAAVMSICESKML